MFDSSPRLPYRPKQRQISHVLASVQSHSYKSCLFGLQNTDGPHHLFNKNWLSFPKCPHLRILKLSSKQIWLVYFCLSEPNLKKQSITRDPVWKLVVWSLNVIWASSKHYLNIISVASQHNFSGISTSSQHHLCVFSVSAQHYWHSSQTRNFPMLFFFSWTFVFRNKSALANAIKFFANVIF